MSFLKRNNKLDVLVKAQNNLSGEKQIEAAYAMNFCMVSISQIIDYDDIYILEQEYEYILNNLNLEKMPKDESLLNIFKLLLDTITFFRIQEGDKKFIEEEYQHRMKNAIWSAIPNIGLLVAGGSWQTTLISLASQVGIGYMNYRREKSQNNLDKKEQEWQLTRSAIEQFNGLRRELFETAWRLAEKYNFPDKFRITENQITQFNKILIDTNSARKFERLEYIKDKFEAYPPFWYYLGNAANDVYQKHNRDEDSEEYSPYKLEAINAFKEYLKLTKHNILREDPLAASCALELFDLIDDIEEKTRLLDLACKYAGNSLDVLQICAISYLEIGNIEKACDILRMLVNEGYNSSLNCRLLSKLYVEQYSNAPSENSKLEYKQKYDALKARIRMEDKYLFFPMPLWEEKETSQSEIYISSQKKFLIDSYANAISRYIIQCESNYNEILFHSSDDIRDEITIYIKEMCDTIETLLPQHHLSAFFRQIKEQILKMNLESYLLLHNDRISPMFDISFDDIFENAFLFMSNEIKKRISTTKDMKAISKIENRLYTFTAKAKISIDYGLTFKSDIFTFAKELWHKDFYEKSDHWLIIQDLFSNYTTESLLTRKYISSENINLIRASDDDFNAYCRDNLLCGLCFFFIPDKFASKVIAILSSKKKEPLIFTENGIVYNYEEYKYKDIQIDENNNIIFAKNTLYENKYINMSVLKSLINNLTYVSTKYDRSQDDSLASRIKALIQSTSI